jgi:hypothetical protein
LSGNHSDSLSDVQHYLPPTTITTTNTTTAAAGAAAAAGCKQKQEAICGIEGEYAWGISRLRCGRPKE